MKILYITTIGITMGFFKSTILDLINNGHTVDIAANEEDFSVPDYYKELGCTIYPVSWTRSPLAISNLIAIKEIKSIVTKTKYNIIHCHTPVASVCTRFACRNFRNSGTKVIYTAHGFHFYKGSKIANWILYYPIEKICAHWTDILITINKEDYIFALKNVKAKKVVYVPGVGIDIKRFKNKDNNQYTTREKIGIPKDTFLLLSIGELNNNKNHQIVIRAIASLGIKNIHYMIAGVGDNKKKLEILSKELGVREQVHLLGYRKDVIELYKAANVYILPSIREGLNVSLMEAMASGLPCIVSNIRGNVDLIIRNTGGHLCNPYKVNEFCDALLCLLKNPILCKMQGEFNANIIENFSNSVVSTIIRKLYIERE